VAAAAGDSSLHISPFAGPSLRADLEIELPRKASLGITTQHGDVKISGRDGDVTVTDTHGDVSVSDVNGDVKLTMNHGDASVSQVKGNTEIGGHASDVSVNDVSGTVSLSGDFFGDTSLAKIGKEVRFTSSRTTMEMGALAGELKMDSGDLTVRSASGGFRIQTRSKDMHLEDLSGDVEVENSNADVELHAGKLGKIRLARGICYKLRPSIGKVSGHVPERQVLETLRHFKELMEAGEIPSIKGQPTGKGRKA